MFSLYLLTTLRPKGQLHSIYQSIKHRQNNIYFFVAQGLRSAWDYDHFTFHRANFRLNLPVNSETQLCKDLIRSNHKIMSRHGSFTWQKSLGGIRERERGRQKRRDRAAAAPKRNVPQILIWLRWSWADEQSGCSAINKQKPYLTIINDCRCAIKIKKK